MALALVMSCGGSQITVTSIEPSTGPASGGTQVTVTGTNLGRVESIEIGGVALTGLTVLGDTSIAGTTGPGPAGAQDVVVTAARGSVTVPGGFTYVAEPPAVTAVSPDVGPLSGGTSITITGTGFTEVQSVTIGGQGVTGLSVSGDTSLTAISPAGAAGAQEVVVVTSHGFGALAGGFHYAEFPRQFGTAANDQGAGIAIDAAGDEWVAGTTQGAFTSFTNAGNDDLVLVKYGAGGAQAIAQRGSRFADRARAVAADRAGRVWAVGDTLGPLFNSGAGGSDYFMLVRSTTGSVYPLFQSGTNADDHAYGITTDDATPYTNAYVVGETRGTFPNFTNAGGADLFFFRYHFSNGFQWFQQLGTAGDDRATGVAYDRSSGDIYVVGTTTGGFPGYANVGGSDVFVMRLNPAGAVQWLRQFGTEADDTAEGVALDPSGNVYLVGSTMGTFPNATASGGSDLFVAKLDPTGAPVWTRQFGTPEVELPGGIAVDGAGNAYVIGSTHGEFPGFTNAGEADVVLAKLNANGVPQWARQFGSPGADEGSGIALDRGGTIHVTGWTGGDLPGCAGAGLTDMFIARFDAAGLRL